MSGVAARRCRRDQIAWRIRYSISTFLTDPATLRFLAAGLGFATVLVSLGQAVR